MKLRSKKASKKSGRSFISITLYIVAFVVALVGVASLVNNVLMFTSNVNQYVSQGYTASDVISQLIPAQLLPGVFEPIGIYGGISFILLGIGIANKKISRCLALLSKNEALDNTIEEKVLKQDNIDEKNDV